MPPKTRFTSDRVLGSAFELVRVHGVDHMTARTLAEHLGCSTAPIFRSYPSMDALFEALMDKIICYFMERLEQTHHDNPLVGAGIGWLRFAAEEPRLYEAVFLRMHPWSGKWWPIRELWVHLMGRVDDYMGLSESERNALVGRASIVMHGLGLEIWSGRIHRADFEALVLDLAMPVVESALISGRFDDPHGRSLCGES